MILPIQLAATCFVLTNPLGRNLISVLVLTNPLGRNLISVFVLTNPLGRNLISSLSYPFTCSFGRRLISALVLTSHLKCQTTLLILLCLAAPFFNGPRLFLFSISYIFGRHVNILKLIHYLLRAGHYYNFYSGFC